MMMKRTTLQMRLTSEVPPETQTLVSVPEMQRDAWAGISTMSNASWGCASETQTPAHTGVEHMQQHSRESMMEASLKLREDDQLQRMDH
ncbi:hypothetical protein Y1Q_0017682 [Alligator mississippiensis]|uniref:Uncharacterized protein n=1 Tax=Alligator mississippiensis TaxID=8496 RepID=A0A151MLC0_ALLMI|nr:hypothetical protein Y1Q_0017682 [Alligator mississippiensis]